MSATWHRALDSSVAEAAPVRVDIAGNAVLVYVIDQLPYAVADVCLHRGVSLEGGRCVDGFIECPSHWWRYDMRDGSLQGSPGEALPTYPARLAPDGVIEVFAAPATPPLSLREALLAHAREGLS